MDIELSPSLDEADCAAVVGARTSADPEASFNHETPKEPDAPYLWVSDPKGVSVSVSSSSDSEAMTMPDDTFFGMALGACATQDGVKVPEGKYSESRSSSKPMTRRADGETDFDRPLA